MQEYIGLIVAVAVVLVVIALQVFSFLKTKKNITALRDLFKEVDNLSLKETSVTSDVLRNKSSLQKFLENIPSRIEEGLDEDYINLSLIVSQKEGMPKGRLGKIIHRTNEYLCKNTGTSADLSVLRDISDNQKGALEDDIQNSLNVPLYLGLAGTFVGIITGLIGVDFNQIFGTTSNLDGLQHLLYGVVAAMFASLLGLGFTVYNSAISYKNAVSKSNEGTEEYINF